MHQALDRSITLFDTAEQYGPFTNEDLLGRALQGHLQRVVLATKFGFSLENNLVTGLCSRPEQVRAAVEGS